MSRIFDLPFRVIRWSDRSTVIEVVAQCLNFSVAEAACDAAMTAWPGEKITLQPGIRVMRCGRGGREKSCGGWHRQAAAIFVLPQFLTYTFPIGRADIVFCREYRGCRTC